MYNITTLGRLIDPKFATNLAIVVVTLLTIIGSALFRLVAGDPFWTSVGRGVSAGLAVFLTWAAARELDPDHPYAAFVAAGLMLLAAFIWSELVLLPIVWLLLGLRTVNRSIGLRPKLTDSIAIFLLGGWLSWSFSWLFGLGLVVIFLLDSRLAPANARQIWFGAAAALLTIVLAIAEQGQAGSDLPFLLGVVLVISSGLFLLVIYHSRQVSALADVGGQALRPVRVQAAQALALLLASLLVLVQAEAGFITLLPLWAGILGTGLYHLALVRQ